MAENRELALVLKLVADQFQKELKTSQGALGQFNSFIKDWRTQLVAAGTALFAIAKSAADYGDQLAKTSQRIGVNVEALAALQHAAKLSDVNNQELQLGLQALSRAMVDTAQGVGEGMEGFQRLGISATDANHKLRPMEEVLLDIADVFSQTEDGAGKTEVAMKLLGKSGALLIPLLNQGKGAIKETMEEARRLGLVLSEEDAKAAEKFNDEITRLQGAIRGITLQIGKALIPTLTEMITLFRTAGIGTGLGTGLHILHQQLLMFNTLLKEIVANWRFAFGGGKDSLTLEGLRKEIAAIEADAKRRLFEFKHPGVLSPEPTGTDKEPPAAKKQIASINDQQKLGKALLDIFLARNRAMDIGFDLQAKKQAEQRQAMEDTAAAQQRIDAAWGARQEAMGRAIVANALAERQRAQAELSDLAANTQAWIAYHQQVGGSTELRLQKELQAVRVNLAQQLDLTEEDADKLILAWEAHENELATLILDKTTLTERQRETIQLQTLTRLGAVHEAASENIFDGWTKGMQRYVQDTKSGFGLGADMARRTAQAMEAAFRTFFFDLFEGRVKSLKDVLKGVLDFVKQIAAQITAQLAVKGALQAFGFGAAHGGLVQRFAIGGPVLGYGNQDTIPALLTPGEFVLSRRDVSDIKRGVAAPASGRGNITVNLVNSGARDKPDVNVRQEFDGAVIDVIFRNVQGNGPLRRLIQGG